MPKTSSSIIGGDITEVVENLSKCIPIQLHLKLRQAEELLIIHSKHDIEPIKKEFDQNLKDKKTTFNMLVSAFTDMKGKSNLKIIGKEFKYINDLIGLCRQPNMNCNWKEFNQGKTKKEENITEILGGIDSSCAADGSALDNARPTGDGAALCRGSSRYFQVGVFKWQQFHWRAHRYPDSFAASGWGPSRGGGGGGPCSLAPWK